MYQYPYEFPENSLTSQSNQQPAAPTRHLHHTHHSCHFFIYQQPRSKDLSSHTSQTVAFRSMLLFGPLPTTQCPPTPSDVPFQSGRLAGRRHDGLVGPSVALRALLSVARGGV